MSPNTDDPAGTGMAAERVIPARADAGLHADGPGMQVIPVTGDVARITLPGGADPLQARYTRAGDDLQLELPDGRIILLADWFALGESGTLPTLITESGARIPGDTASRLADVHGDRDLALAHLQEDTGTPYGSIGPVIGTVDAVKGMATVQHHDGTAGRLEDGSPVYQGDVIATGKGAALGIMFADSSTLSMGGEARLHVDRMVYDPESHAGTQIFDALQGAFVFAGGYIALGNADDVAVRTPTATIGIRGTKYALNVDGADGATSVTVFEGAVTVANDFGTRVLSSARQSVRVESYTKEIGEIFTLDRAAQAREYGDAIAYAVGAVLLPRDDDVLAEAGAVATDGGSGPQDDDGNPDEGTIPPDDDDDADDGTADDDAVGEVTDLEPGSSFAADPIANLVAELRALAQEIATPEIEAEADALDRGDVQDLLAELAEKDDVAAPVGTVSNVTASNVSLRLLGDDAGFLNDEGTLPTAEDAPEEEAPPESLPEVPAESPPVAVAPPEPPAPPPPPPPPPTPPVLPDQPTQPGEVEDGPDVALTLTPATHGGGATISYRISGVGDGVLNKGTPDAGGNWILEPGDLAGLTINPADNFSGVLDLSITAIATAAHGGTSESETKSLPVIITPDADAPTLGPQGNVTGVEDAPGGIALNITAGALTDPSETLSYVISGVTKGTLSAGMDKGAGVWTVETGDIGGVRFLPAEDVSGPVNLSVKAISTETDNSTAESGSESLLVNITPVADEPTVTAASPGGNEDARIPLNITALPKAGSGEAITRIEISGIPAGSALEGGGGGIPVTPAGTAVITDLGKLAGMTIKPPLHDADDFTLTVTATAADGTARQTGAETVTVTVNPVADRPTPLRGQTDVTGDEDTDIPFAIDTRSSPLRDFDGSEVLSYRISGVENGTLSVGTVNPADSKVWNLTKAEAAGPINFEPDDNFHGIVNLSVKAVATEPNGDEATTPARGLKITVNPLPDVPDLPTQTAVTVVEDAGAFDLNISPAIPSGGVGVGSPIASYTIANIPAELTLKDAGGTDIPTPGGTATITETMLAADPDIITGLTLTPDAHYATPPGGIPLLITATADDGTPSVPETLQLTVTPDADVPNFTDPADVNGPEDGGTIALGITKATATDTDGSEVLSYEITGVTNGRLSKGTDDGGGKWILNETDIAAGVGFTPDADFSGDVNLTITATSTEIGTPAEFEPVQHTQKVTVTPVANPPTLATSTPAPSGDEDTAIPLNLSITGGDTGETVVYEVTGIPDGATLTYTKDGTSMSFAAPDDGSGPHTYTIPDGAILSSVAITPPEHSSDTITLNIRPVATDGTSTVRSVTPLPVNVIVNPVADAPDLDPQDPEEVSEMVSDGTFAGPGGGRTGITFSLTPGALVDTDRSETLSYELSGIPSVMELRDSGGTLLNGPAGALTTTATVPNNKLADLRLVPPENFAGIANLNLRAVATEAGASRAQSAPQAVVLTVRPSPDAPNLSAGNVAGNEDTAIDLGITAGLTDRSENLSLEISNIPAGAVLEYTDGTVVPVTGDKATITDETKIGNLATVGLTLTPAENTNGDIPLTITATSEIDTSHPQYLPTLPPTASVTSFMVVAVNPVPDTPIWGTPTGAVTPAAGTAPTVIEDAWPADGIALTITPPSFAPDTHGSVASYRIANIPDGAILQHRAGTTVTPIAVDASGTATIADPADITDLFLTPAEHFAGTRDLTITAISNDGTAADAPLRLDITPVADAPSFAIAPGTRVVGEANSGAIDFVEYPAPTAPGTPVNAIPQAVLTDNDGSESVWYKVDNILPGARVHLGGALHYTAPAAPPAPALPPPNSFIISEAERAAGITITPATNTASLTPDGRTVTVTAFTVEGGGTTRPTARDVTPTNSVRQDLTLVVEPTALIFNIDSLATLPGGGNYIPAGAPDTIIPTYARSWGTQDSLNYRDSDRFDRFDSANLTHVDMNGVDIFTSTGATLPSGPDGDITFQLRTSNLGTVRQMTGAPNQSLDITFDTPEFDLTKTEVRINPLDGSSPIAPRTITGYGGGDNITITFDPTVATSYLPNNPHTGDPSPATRSITGGMGNQTFVVDNLGRFGSGAGNNLKIDGGAGTGDVLKITDTGSAGSALNIHVPGFLGSDVSNIEILDFSTPGGNLKIETTSLGIMKGPGTTPRHTLDTGTNDLEITLPGSTRGIASLNNFDLSQYRDTTPADDILRSNGTITVTGNAEANTLTGSSGTDILKGEGGDDTFMVTDVAHLTGDTIDGGAGNDTITITATAANINLAKANSISKIEDIDTTGANPAAKIRVREGDFSDKLNITTGQRAEIITNERTVTPDDYFDRITVDGNPGRAANANLTILGTTRNQDFTVDLSDIKANLKIDGGTGGGKAGNDTLIVTDTGNSLGPTGAPVLDLKGGGAIPTFFNNNIVNVKTVDVGGLDNKLRVEVDLFSLGKNSYALTGGGDQTLIVNVTGTATQRAQNLLTPGHGFKHVEIRGDHLPNDFRGSKAADLMYGEDGNDTIKSYAGDDEIEGGAGNDTLEGGTGDDTINGGTGNDTIEGGADNDTIDGGEGADRIDGDAGDDTIRVTDIGHLDGDRINGGRGTDILEISDATPGVPIDLTKAASITNIETIDVSGTDPNATIIISPALLNGLHAAGDTITGMGAGHTLSIAVDGNAAGNTVGDLINHGVITTGVPRDQIVIQQVSKTNDKSITGSVLSDRINGNDGNDILIGGRGADTLNGGAGDDRFVITPLGGRADLAGDSIDGGAGRDELDLTAVGTTPLNFSGTSFTMTNVEQITASGDLTLSAAQIGSAVANGLTHISGDPGTPAQTLSITGLLPPPSTAFLDLSGITFAHISRLDLTGLPTGVTINFDFAKRGSIVDIDGDPGSTLSYITGPNLFVPAKGATRSDTLAYQGTNAYALRDLTATLIKIDHLGVAVSDPTVPPLVFDLDGDGVALHNVDDGVLFDMDGDGLLERAGWFGPGDGLLTLDVNGDGRINDITEVVSPHLNYGDGAAAGATTDLEALSAFDDNGDGVIDRRDGIFGHLQLWQDGDSDGVTDAGELQSLTDHGITEISLTGSDEGAGFVGDNEIVQTTTASRVVTDAVSATLPAALPDLPPEAVLTLGREEGNIHDLRPGSARPPANPDTGAMLADGITRIDLTGAGPDAILRLDVRHLQNITEIIGGPGQILEVSGLTGGQGLPPELALIGMADVRPIPPIPVAGIPPPDAADLVFVPIPDYTPPPPPPPPPVTEAVTVADTRLAWREDATVTRADLDARGGLGDADGAIDLTRISGDAELWLSLADLIDLGNGEDALTVRLNEGDRVHITDAELGTDTDGDSDGDGGMDADAGGGDGVGDGDTATLEQLISLDFVDEAGATRQFSLTLDYEQ